MKPRLVAYVRSDLQAKVAAAGQRPGCSQSQVVEAALDAFFSFAADDQRDARIIERLDRIGRQLARMERDGQAHLELTGQFARLAFYLAPPIPDADRASARALAERRYDTLLELVAQRFAPGRTLLGEALAEAVFSEDAFVNGARNGAHAVESEASR
ncbi:MAG: hypothetical protein PVI23_16875 [Maricaulaceae bacterium]|jgi:hypothetical protein